MPFLDRAFPDKIFLDDPVRWDGVAEFFHPCNFVPAGNEWPVMDFTQEPGNCRSGRFVQLKMRAEILDRNPLFRPAGILHVLLQQLRNIRISGHGTDLVKL